MKEIEGLSEQEIENRLRMLENNIRAMKTEERTIQHRSSNLSFIPSQIKPLSYHNSLNILEDAQARVKENQEKIKMNKQLPWLVSNVVEVLVRIVLHVS